MNARQHYVNVYGDTEWALQKFWYYCELFRRANRASCIRSVNIGFIEDQLFEFAEAQKQELEAKVPGQLNEIKGRGMTVVKLRNDYKSNLMELLKRLVAADPSYTISDDEKCSLDEQPYIDEDFLWNFIEEVSILDHRMKRVKAYGFAKADKVEYENLDTSLIE